MGFILDQNVKININGLQIDGNYSSLQSTIGYKAKFELIDDSIENNINLKIIQKKSKKKLSTFAV